MNLKTNNDTSIGCTFKFKLFNIIHTQIQLKRKWSFSQSQ